MFSVEKAICPSVSSEGLVPTGRKRDGHLKMGRRKDGRRDEERRGVMEGQREEMKEETEEGRKEGADTSVGLNNLRLIKKEGVGG